MIFDLIVLGVIVISCGLAFFRGFIREVLTIAGLLAGGAAAVAFGPRAAPFFAHLLHARRGAPAHYYFGVLPAPMLADILAYGLIFLLVAIVFSLFSHLLSGAAKKVGLGPLNRSFGVLFGLLRAALLIGLFYLPVYEKTTPAKRDGWAWLAGSHARPYVEELDAWLVTLIPASLLDTTERRLEAATRARTGDGENAARDKLNELQLLGRGSHAPERDDGAQPPPFPPASRSLDRDSSSDDAAPADGAADTGGYASGQRRTMNDLIKDIHGGR